MGPIRRGRRLDGATITQFVKYGIVGAANTALTFVTYSLLVEAGLQYQLAVICGWVVGGTNSYMFNRHWTFKAGHIAHARSGTRFAVVTACSAAVNAALLPLLPHHSHTDKILSQAVLTIPILCITFLANRLWTFTDGPAVVVGGNE
jgi:putative flippase GtrA